MYIARRRIKTKKLRNVFIGRKNTSSHIKTKSPLLPTKPQPKSKRKKIKDKIMTPEFWKTLGYPQHRMELVLSLKVDTKQI